MPPGSRTLRFISSWRSFLICTTARHSLREVKIRGSGNKCSLTRSKGPHRAAITSAIGTAQVPKQRPFALPNAIHRLAGAVSMVLRFEISPYPHSSPLGNYCSNKVMVPRGDADVELSGDYDITVERRIFGERFSSIRKLGNSQSIITQVEYFLSGDFVVEGEHCHHLDRELGV